MGRRLRIFRLGEGPVRWRSTGQHEGEDDKGERREEVGRRREWGWLPAFVGNEGAQGEEGCPEAAFGVGVVESRGESGKPEPTHAFRPDEPRALGGFRERHFHQRVVT